MNVIAEGPEVILQNTVGDTLVVSKENRAKALKYLRTHNYAALDKLASESPTEEDYAEDGSLYTNTVTEGIDPVKKQITETKPEKSTFSKVLSAVTLGGSDVIKERLSKNLDPYGQAAPLGRVYDAVIKDEVDPERQQRESMASKDLRQAQSFDEEYDIKKARNRLDAYSLYNEEEQRFNSLNKSEYVPGTSKNNTNTYLDVNDPIYKQNLAKEAPRLLERRNTLRDIYNTIPFEGTAEEIAGDRTKFNEITEQLVNEHTTGKMSLLDKGKMALGMDFETGKSEITPEALDYYKTKFPGLSQKELVGKALEMYDYNYKTEGIRSDIDEGVMGNHFITFGENKGKPFASYYDKWDINPLHLSAETNFGKPYEIYGRVGYDEKGNQFNAKTGEPVDRIDASDDGYTSPTEDKYFKEGIKQTKESFADFLTKDLDIEFGVKTLEEVPKDKRQDYVKASMEMYKNKYPEQN